MTGKQKYFTDKERVTGSIMQEQHYAVAIDGPAGAGKSTLARAVAAALGILYVDTGAIYRTIGWAVRCRGIDPHDAPAVEAILPELDVAMTHAEGGEQRMLLDGTDVSAEIRLPEMSMYASAVSAMPAVRAYLLEMQRALARRQSVVMDGRDIGTVVLPEAEVKIFLTASSEVRAMRRWRELVQRGTEKPYEEVLSELVERDYNDSHRAAAPLRAAGDAVVLDTSELNFEQSREAILEIIRRNVK